MRYNFCRSHSVKWKRHGKQTWKRDCFDKLKSQRCGHVDAIVCEK